MAKFKRNLITTALPYANGPVHIWPVFMFRPIFMCAICGKKEKK